MIVSTVLLENRTTLNVTLIDVQETHRGQDDRLIWASGHGVVLLVGLTAFAFVSGYWGILIALAPAAYLPAFFPNDSDNAPTVVVSHLLALIAGWVADTVLAQGISPTSIEPTSEPGLRVVGSALLPL